eukprot:1145497-Pelagomonas_calceolata.AAC.4
MLAYQALFAVPFDHNVHKPIRLPGYLHLDLSQHVMQNISRFRKRKRKVYASQDQLCALWKGSLTSKLARASPRRLTGPA